MHESIHAAGGVIADSMGSGKTFMSILCILDAKKRGLGTALIITKSALRTQWALEAKKYVQPGYLKIRILDDDSGLSASDILEQDAVIVSYDTVLGQWKRRAQNSSPYFPLFSELFDLYEKPFSMVVLDECHVVKNAKSKTLQAIENLRYRSILLLSGSIAEDKWQDIYVPRRLCIPGVLRAMGLCVTISSVSEKRRQEEFNEWVSAYDGTSEASQEFHASYRLQRPLLAFIVCRPTSVVIRDEEHLELRVNCVGF